MILHRERQKFSWIIRGILYLILIPLAGILIYILYKQAVEGIPMGSKPASNFLLAMLLLVCILLVVLFSIAYLEVTITKHYVEYKWYPFSTKSSRIQFADVSSIEVIKYPFIGLGFRINSKYGIANIVKGQYGISITLKNNEKRLIGVSSPEQVRKVLSTIIIG